MEKRTMRDPRIMISTLNILVWNWIGINARVGKVVVNLIQSRMDETIIVAVFLLQMSYRRMLI